MARFIIGGRSYSIAPSAEGKTRLSQAAFDALYDSLVGSVGGAAADVAMQNFEVRVPRASGGVNASRDGGPQCPFFGEVGHWLRSEFSADPDVAAGKCGKKRNGRFTPQGIVAHEAMFDPLKVAEIRSRRLTS